MPIATKCKCGNKFAAPDHLAGKQVKCPGCKQPLAIPTRALATSNGDSIPTKCGCGKTFTAPAKLQGKTIKCPQCQKPITIQSAGSGKSVLPATTAQASAKTPALVTNAATIETKCSCGHTFQAPQRLAGKAIRCPQCQSPVRVPASPQGGGSGIDALLDEVGFQRAAAANRCPECKEDMEEDSILCVKCGYNVDTGRTLTTKIVGKRDGLEGSGASMLGRPDLPTPPPVKIAAGIYLSEGIVAVVGGLAQLGTALMGAVSGGLNVASLIAAAPAILGWFTGTAALFAISFAFYKFLNARSKSARTLAMALSTFRILLSVGIVVLLSRLPIPEALKKNISLVATVSLFPSLAVLGLLLAKKSREYFR